MNAEESLNHNYNESALINNPIENEENNDNYDINDNNEYADQNNDNYIDLQNQLMNNNETNFIEKFSSQEIYEILNDLIPSLFYSFIIYYSFKNSSNYCDPNMYLMLKTLLCIYIAYIFNAIYKSYLIYKNKLEKNSLKISLLLIGAILSTFYLFSVFLSYFIYSKSDSKCFVQDNFITLVFYGLLFIGMINLFQKIINITLIFGWFIAMINTFFDNPSYFYSHYGVDPEIIKNLPTFKADKKHISCCVICTEEIKEGDEIMILKCPGKHFFHAECIKSWLIVKTTCPMCRSENVL